MRSANACFYMLMYDSTWRMTYDIHLAFWSYWSTCTTVVLYSRANDGLKREWTKLNISVTDCGLWSRIEVPIYDVGMTSSTLGISWTILRTQRQAVDNQTPQKIDSSASRHRIPFEILKDPQSTHHLLHIDNNHDAHRPSTIGEPFASPRRSHDEWKRD